MTEQAPGPLESEIHEFIRSRGMAMPEMIEANFTGTEPSDVAKINIAWRMNEILREALLRVAREVDDLRIGG